MLDLFPGELFIPDNKCIDEVNRLNARNLDARFVERVKKQFEKGNRRSYTNSGVTETLRKYKILSKFGEKLVPFETLKILHSISDLELDNALKESFNELLYSLMPKNEAREVLSSETDTHAQMTEALNITAEQKNVGTQTEAEQKNCHIQQTNLNEENVKPSKILASVQTQFTNELCGDENNGQNILKGSEVYERNDEASETQHETKHEVENVEDYVLA